MKCLLVFDYSNDVIYTKYNKKFASHINDLAKLQGLTSEQNKNAKISSNIIVQIFSPIVTSQRIMSCQFGNSYTSIQCDNGLNMAFEEFMGYLFVSIGQEDVAAMKRFLSVCVTIVRYLCGPDVVMLKSNKQIASIVTSVIDSWIYLHNTEQLMLIEAIEQLMINSDLSSSALKTLQEAVDRLQAVIERPKVHALILVQNKFLGLYSSRTATSLSSTDILFFILLCNVNNLKNVSNETDTETDSEEEFYSPQSSPVHASETQLKSGKICNYQVMLAGNDFVPKCVPHVIYISTIEEGVDLLLIIEVGNALISSGLYDTFFHLNAIQTAQIQRDIETLKPAFDNLDTAIKKLTDGLKKVKNSTFELSYKQLSKQWDYMRKKYLEFIKANCSDALLRAESATMNFLDILKELLNLTAFDNSVLNASQVCVKEIVNMVQEKLESFNEFFRAKALRNFTLGSRDSLTINKYLEEFPGLVHFIYVDRTTHRVTTPTLDFTSSETVNLTKKKIWSMIHFSRNHLQEGHLSLMWKDTTFNYAYFLWFEDTSGTALKPTIFPTNASKALPQPGILCGDFYQKLKEACFPKMSPTKVRCYELFCIHLGLATASCVLEHTRRLAATIWELRGHPNHPIDLL
uniref:Hermansky-Pudlak syndrome 1 protein homolog n=1 Tax=Photinus pyralis TaxID=7054 RepID=A0A1Y1JYQ2_PHOPY